MRTRSRAVLGAVRLGEPVPATLREARVHGVDGIHRLGDLVHGPTLIVFLRHFG